jgi:predicted dinucleotide-binding enzyme
LKHSETAHANQRLGLTVAGPATEDKQRVFSLIDQLGFDPVDSGELDQSWRLQPGTPTYCRDMNAEQLRKGLTETTRANIGNYHANRDQFDFDAAVKKMGERM